MKKLVTYIFIILIWSNFSHSSEHSYFKCKSQKHYDISEFEILNNYRDGFLVFSHSIMNIKYLNFGFEWDGKIRSFMSDSNTGGLLYYEISKKDNNKIKIELTQFESNNIRNLNSKSIFYGKNQKQNQINLELTNKELDKEIDNHTVNQRYLTDLFSKGPEITRSEIVMREVYSCEKAIKTDANLSKPSLDQIEVMKLGCIGDEPYEKKKAFCNCYGDWFYENLNQAEYDKFLLSSREDKIKFLEKNEIIKNCKLYSEIAPKADKYLKELNNN